MTAEAVSSSDEASRRMYDSLVEVLGNSVGVVFDNFRLRTGAVVVREGGIDDPTITLSLVDIEGGDSKGWYGVSTFTPESLPISILNNPLDIREHLTDAARPSIIDQINRLGTLMVDIDTIEARF